MYHQGPIRLLHFDSSTICFEHRGKHFAVDIQLELLRSCVADAHWCRLFVAREPRNFGFIEAALAANAVHDLHLRSEEHTSELQSHSDLVCRLLLEKKKK